VRSNLERSVETLKSHTERLAAKPAAKPAAKKSAAKKR
jgi:hypothetical protein